MKIETQRAPQVFIENIPDPLKQIPFWTMWAFDKNKPNRHGKFPKVPYFGPGTKAKISDSKTWLNFNEAVKFLENDFFGGINFAFTKAHPFIGIDLDNCVTENGELNTLAQTVVKKLNSYTEYSPSGSGIRIIIKAPEGFEIEDRNDQLQGIEVYKNAHFLSITGNTLHINPTIEERSDEILDIINNMMHPSTKEKLVEIKEEDIKKYSGHNEENSKILKRIFMNSKKNPSTNTTYGEYYETLYKHGYVTEDKSIDDWKFSCELIYQCAGDIQKAKNILETSAIYHSRDKWQENRRGYGTYADMTLLNALRLKKPTIDKMLEKKQAAKDLKSATRAEGKPWWNYNPNGTRSFVHSELARLVMERFSIAHYPSIHSDLYIYNPNEGIYEQDTTGRQLSHIIRSFDTELKTSHIKEVAAFINDTARVVNSLNERFIAVANGLIDLETFELINFSSEVFLTKKIGTNYKHDAFDDFVDSTLRKVTNGYEPSLANLKEMFACVLYQEILVPKMFYLYGRTAHNGKSAILNLIHSTFNTDGKSISAVSPQKLASNTFAAASMYGKLANIVDDQPDQLIEDSGTLKTIITGGYVDIEFKGKNSETVKMNVTMITASNFYPNFKESGKQINRRLHIIPFEHDFSNDPDCLSDSESMRLTKSESAREYVLKLAVDALKQMLLNPTAEKLTHNPKAIEASESFAIHNDPLADYFAECSVEDFENVPGNVALARYEQWCQDYHTVTLPAKKFKERVCTEFNMDWKQKRITWNGKSISTKGFKSRN